MNRDHIWDFWADKYERLWVQKYSLGPSRKAIIKKIDSVLQKVDHYRILDMGCGTGQLLREMQERFSEFDISYLGVDASHGMIKAAGEKSKDIGYVISSVEDFDEGEGAYDIIVCSHSFPYYKDKAHIVEKLYRLMKKGGLLILVQASGNNLYDILALSFVKLTTSRAEYLSKKNMVALLENNFENVEVATIKERFYMPSICMFTAVKGEKS